MPRANKKSTGKRKAAIVVCTYCGSEKTIRVSRSLFDKLLCFITLNRFAYQKYYCKLCDHYIYKSKAESFTDALYPEENIPLKGDDPD
jgi:hypothetical protein